MFYIYILIIFICLAVSILNTTARQNKLWIYFSFILGSEILVYSGTLTSNFYMLANIFHVVFFLWFFQKETIHKKENKILLMVSFAILGLGIYIKKDVYGINTNTFKSFTFILLSVYWFIDQIKNPNEILIYKKMAFWVSVSILLWSVVFLMRIVPAYFFAQEDIQFLENIINRLYQITVIICYLLFLRGLFCRQ